MSKATGQLEWQIVSVNRRETLAWSRTSKPGQATRRVSCSTPVSSAYVKECSIAGTMREVLAALVVDGPRSKLYLPPSVTPVPDDATCLKRTQKVLEEESIAAFDEKMNTQDSTTVAGRGYGIEYWHQLFTPRHLLCL